VTQATKRCTKCSEEKLLTDFYLNKLAKDGKDSWCKDCVTRYNRQYYAQHSEEIKAYRKKYYREHLKEIKIWAKLHHQKNKEVIGRKQYEYQHQQTILLRQQVLERFGGKCERCGFDDSRALQIDHIHSDGAKERKTNRGVKFLSKLLKLNDSELKGNYQLLCANCQWIKRFENREHQSKYERKVEFKISGS
jgi:hypothetical protein